MSLEEINKKAYEKYPVKMVPDDDTMGFTSTDVNEAARNGYIEAYKEISSLPTIKGWVARDENGEVWFYMQKPHRNGRMWTIGSGDGRYVIYLAHISFPGLGWGDDPIEVELPIIRK